MCIVKLLYVEVSIRDLNDCTFVIIHVAVVGCTEDCDDWRETWASIPFVKLVAHLLYFMCSDHTKDWVLGYESIDSFFTISSKLCQEIQRSKNLIDWSLRDKGLLCLNRTLTYPKTCEQPLLEFLMNSLYSFSSSKLPSSLEIGSAHSKSHKGPNSGTSIFLSIWLMSFKVFTFGEIPPWTHKYFPF